MSKATIFFELDDGKIVGYTTTSLASAASRVEEEYGTTNPAKDIIGILKVSNKFNKNQRLTVVVDKNNAKIND